MAETLTRLSCGGEESEEVGEQLLPDSVILDGAELESMFAEAAGVYRELPLQAWDPTLTGEYTEKGYVDGEEAVSELQHLSDEWRIEPTETVFYHQQGLRCRGTVAMEYEGTLDVGDARVTVPFRADIARHTTADEAEQLANSYLE
ncbi:MAG: hypothetical protein SVU32_08175 [Candidatus Nanohaloarchaea archaeon]|nr:hypothetical protein [Candidatus Nanohaloarchaea archaeon]